jgi:hypothetical protein
LTGPLLESKVPYVPLRHNTPRKNNKEDDDNFSNKNNDSLDLEPHSLDMEDDEVGGFTNYN